MKKKTLVITGLNEKMSQLLPAITNKKAEELMVLNSYGAVITNPYDSMMRSVILSIYNENVEDIYIVLEKESKEHVLNKNVLTTKLKNAGITKETLKTIEYIDVLDEAVINWLAGPNDEEKILQKNLMLLQKHPLMPKTVSIYGYIVSQEGEVKAVS